MRPEDAWPERLTLLVVNSEIVLYGLDALDAAGDLSGPALETYVLGIAGKCNHTIFYFNVDIEILQLRFFFQRFFDLLR